MGIYRKNKSNGKSYKRFKLTYDLLFPYKI